MILSGSNELVVLVNSSLVGLKVVVFEEMSGICRFCINKIALEMARMEAICRIT